MSGDEISAGAIAAMREKALLAEIEHLRQQLRTALRLRPVYGESEGVPSLPDFRMVEFASSVQIPAWPKCSIRVGLSMESFSAYPEALNFTVEEATRELLGKITERRSQL